jgi:hypothetical protein
MLDLNLEEEEEQRPRDGWWTEEERLNIVWLWRKQRV